MTDQIKKQIADSISTKEKILNSPAIIEQIEKAAALIIRAYKSGKKTLLAGNGGSAADAQHLAGELVNKFYFDRPALSSFSLSTDTSVMTAVSNDYAFDKVFARQVEANGNSGDVFIGLSTSGNSKNIIEALNVCKEKGLVSICLVGEKPSKMDELCELCIKVPSLETPRIQEAHILIGHMICYLVEESIFGHLKKR